MSASSVSMCPACSACNPQCSRLLSNKKTITRQKTTRRISWGREVPWVVACLCVPVILLCVVCAWSGVYPFGDESFLDDDLLYQYIDFFSWFRRVLTGDGSLFYSFSQTLGVNTWNQYSYYLGSPLNLLVVLFDPARLTDAVVLICSIKLSLMQLSWGTFLRRRLSLDRWDAFLLALPLTWCGWVASNLMNPLWLDMMYLLPPVMLGCHALVREGRWRLLVVATTCSIVFCWYMGYMTCLFAVCYVLFEAYLAHVVDPGLGPRYFLRRALAFTASMMGALALSAWTFLPTILAMMGSGRAWALDPLELRCGTFDLLASFFVGTFRSEETPQVFAATLPLVLFGLFLLDRRVSGRMRVAVLVLLAIGCASVMSALVEFVWCGFRVPNAFYSRTAFLIPVALVWGAAVELRLIRAEGGDLRHLVAVLVALAAIVGVCLLRGKFSHPINVVASIVVLVLVGVALALLMRPRTGATRAWTIASVVTLSLLMCCELVRGAHVMWAQLYTGVSQQHQVSYTEESMAQYDAMRALDDGVWRADKTYTRAYVVALNEGLARGYDALSSYTSTMDMRSVDLLCNLGYSTPGEFCLRYGGTIEPSDSLLGVRFVGTEQGRPALLEETAIEPTSSGGYVYANPRALTLSYGVSQDVLDAQLTPGNPFEAQNQLISAMLGREVQLYKPLPVQEVSRDDMAAEWSVTVPANTLGCVYVVGERMAGQSEIGWLGIEGGAVSSQGNRFSYHVVELGKAKDQERNRSVRLAVTPEVAQDSGAVATEDLALDSTASCLFYGLDLQTLGEALDELRAHELDIRIFEDGYVEGTFEADDDGWLLATFPTDSGWHVTVDGQDVAVQDAFGGAFTAIPVHAGTNSIEMSFVPRGFVAGCVVSAAALVGVAAISLVGRRRQA